MNPLVSETATASITPAIILMETPYVEPRPHDDIIATDDIKQIPETKNKKSKKEPQI